MLQYKTIMKGFGLVETIISIAVFALIAVSVYQVYGTLLEGSNRNQAKIAAINLANEQFEIIRNLPYASVGIAGESASGTIPASQTLTRDGITFTVSATVTPIDYSVDSNAPIDLAPEDNKRVQLDLDCGSCKLTTQTFISYIAPFALETVDGKGALVVQTLDANGQPISSVDIRIQEATTETTLYNLTTDTQGYARVDSIDPATHEYTILATKTGYSSEQTYTIGTTTNPNPDNPHMHVVAGKKSQLTFILDKLSTLLVEVHDEDCSPEPLFDFDLEGEKQIGLQTAGYSTSHQTSAQGHATITALEFDTYNITPTDSTFYLQGTYPLLPLALHPNGTQTIHMVVTPDDANGVLVRIRDAITNLPVGNADVTLEKGIASYSGSTASGTFLQTNWSGGSGQSDFIDATKFSDQTNISTSTVGHITLAQTSGTYETSGNLTSSIFDTGTSTNFHTLTWNPNLMPQTVGTSSIAIQIATNATNTASSTWDFIGPDGTASTSYTYPGQFLHDSHDNDQYIQYKATLTTEDTSRTPTLSDIAILYGESCSVPGQLLLDNVATDTDYTLTVTKNGYTTYTSENVDVSSGSWQAIDIELMPQ